MPAPRRLTDFSGTDVEVQRTASGGFGLVFMGPDRAANKWRALKTLRPELIQRPRVRELFISEALTWVGLWPHANVITAQNVTRINGQPFLVLDYAEQGSVRDWLRRGLPPHADLLWAQCIAAGLDALHTPDPAMLRPDPIVHRDLKPENVLIDRYGAAEITDFGLAKAVEGDSAALALLETDAGGAPSHARTVRTARGVALGTPAYMAPEQWEDAARVGPPADMYAFGIMLSELFAGRHALLDLQAGHSIETWRQAHLRQTPRRLKDRAPLLPQALEDLYQACLAKRAEQRPTARSALVSLQNVARALGQQPYEADSYPHIPETELNLWRRWAIAHDRFGLFDEALRRTARALQIDPHDPGTLSEQGILLAQLGRFDEALRWYDAAQAAFGPDEGRGQVLIWNLRGAALNELRRFAEADAAYAQGLALDPGHADMLHNRGKNLGEWGLTDAGMGWTREAREHLEQGIVYLRRALTISPDDADYRRTLADAQRALSGLDG